MDEDEKYLTSLGMRKFGGSFVEALGIALARADEGNTQIIKEAFPEYCSYYYNLGKKIKNNEEESE